MTTGPILAIPKVSLPFAVECDMSRVELGAVLMQEGKPMAYFSKSLQGSNLSKSTFEKDALALVAAIQKWRPYLLNSKFIVRIDHKSLRHLWGQTITTEAQQKSIMKLMEYGFIIEYKKGRENSIADSLSKCNEHESLNEEEAGILALNYPLPSWMDTIKEDIKDSSQLKKLAKNIQVGEAISP